MDIEVLGGLSVRENGLAVVPATAAARQVLAVLAACPDQLVPASVLAEELTEHAPAEVSRSLLLTCVRQIRTLLAAAGDPAARRTPETVLRAVPGGYLLDTGGGRSDVHEFARHAGAGYRAMARGDHETASRRLRDALGLWRGPAFDGITAGPRLTARIAGLEETRVAVLGQWVEAQLALGRHRELRSELHAAASGRALKAYRELVDVLAADFGRSPADATRAVRRTLLRGAA
ncbi:BTAD domain-containing putative transcriptional regulator [Streptomyces sp. NPDC012888]|uniref:AfsR/SARP family transcriptional regulator n=1 Tax=Streptomyces sp. NPDC012888 TaxID=3364855 RepID=UPI0036CE2158